MTVTADAGKAGIDDMAYARHGQGGLGHVGRQHDTPLPGRLEDAPLVCRAEPRIQGQNFRHLQAMPVQAFCSLTDFPLAGQEDQDVSPVFLGKFIHRIQDGLLGGITPLATVLVFFRRRITHFHQPGAAGYLNHRSIREMPGELLRIDGRRGDDELEITALLQQLLQVAQQEIDVQAAFVSLIQDDGIVFVEKTVLLDFGQQHTVSQQLDMGALAHPVVKTHLVAHGRAQLPLQFGGDAAGQAARSDAPRLGVGDAAINALPHVQADLGQLGGFTRTRFTTEDDDLVFCDQLTYFFQTRANGQLGRVFRHRQRLPARLDRRCRPVDTLFHIGKNGGVERPVLLYLPGQVLQLAAQPVPVFQQALADLFFQVFYGSRHGFSARRNGGWILPRILAAILCRMIFRRINLALVSLLLAVTATCASATDALSQVRNMPDASLLLLDGNGKAMVNHRPEAPRIPASTLKILTAWLAIDHWGLDHRFATDFFLDDGQVLWVKVYGDPMQVSEEIERIAVRLKAKGLTGLNGIRLDGSYFASMAARTAPTPMMPPWRHWLPTSTR